MRACNIQSTNSFDIPAATLLSFIGLSAIILIPIYDTIFVPLTRAITKRPSGITMLQRIGTGIAISVVSMVVAAIVETKRLEVAREYGLVDDPSAIVSVGWSRSIGLALYLSVIGIGSFLSSFLISILQKMTGGNGWISDNMNRGHIDYFYYLLAGISAGAFVIYIYAAKSYVYNRGTAL
ncbi:proton-dependent oligopeptide transporter family [Artemisia annua]|uniref:Proton-dependent oligopeptide transporter family n=1 Tax=Artemisia annua TaxID=35608 RepID=A0A2U1KZ11_ARTAN|nr:proton-dependent oligopeptide transporter family [Artemisia annua]